MNPSTALARVLVDELVRGGVREVVLSPGSRNAPLSVALHTADAAGALRLHVRVDERSAGFLALGLAKASQVPVPVVCTSGTAVANLHPAVLEASHAGVPLVAVTADRPAELRGTGANQTTEQPGVYGAAVRLAVDLPAPEARAGQVAPWRATVCRVLAAAAGELDDDPGPVHLDVAFREPLLPDGTDAWPEPLDGRADGGPWTRVSIAPPVWTGPFDGPRALGTGLERTLVVVGDAPPELARDAGLLAQRRGWPVVAEPSAGVPQALAHGPLLLGAEAFVAAERPHRVLVVGRPTLARPVQRLLRDPEVVVEVVTSSPRWADPGAVATAVHHPSWVAAGLREPAEPPPGAWRPLAGDPAVADAAWARRWQEAAASAARAVAQVLDDAPLSGPAVARALVEALPDRSLLVLGSSSPVRDVDLAAAPREGLAVLANRGLAGIDGTVSTALGAALAHRGPAYALLGDLTLLHDANGLVLGPQEPRPDLVLVVVNDDGGGIFTQLEQGAPEHAAGFERVFGTPTGVDLEALCLAHGTRYELVRDLDALRAALAPAPGLRLVEVPVDRSATRALHARLRAAVAAAVSPPGWCS
ncbi:2-succinyl-5-enolpyruvyl-6-hydroxy-3-cyclohexene-1-carboxylic-acid synthase [Vallicoccus soli]|uniref:2-succinyl-5-enolpyruvyl-6-hydroxy-3-cyclohexene-1-carboxylate synthase n=1 Tax=Vallicoccus soli TaxID=2339232 RepID=A0A3A3YRW5_9ACTN|nr:2-succinyl-5-enolpyruvyl-6-hydroxy-3-cyclohexene-1-carboxylic-acid synthase [Vallicoccus soli]RJK93386.1 2-succinyl-5-enolpyruvyl-6-hydroxy-3-cyclohexene-1-carboxylic-acid synthase [Vallicoccus soli]